MFPTKAAVNAIKVSSLLKKMNIVCELYNDYLSSDVR